LQHALGQRAAHETANPGDQNLHEAARIASRDIRLDAISSKMVSK
jgi:hypothetical protein